MRKQTTVAALFVIMMVGCDGGNELALDVTQQPPPSLAQFETFRMQFRVRNAQGNPYNPDEIDAHVTITTPSGEQQEHPAFFTQDYEIVVSHGREVTRDLGRKHWELRWTPSEAGTYQWQLSVENAGQTASLRGSLECTSSADPGFVQISKTDSRYFETSDGSFFYPIGHVTRSPFDDRWSSLAFDTQSEPDRADNNDTDGALRIAKYERWFRKMREAGENFCAVWMAPWWLELEWSPTRDGFNGLGHYNQRHAAQLDKIMQLAEENGIRVLLFTANHGRWSTAVDPQWFENPHKNERVVTPTDFFRSPDALRYEERRLRYILARWGHSKALFGLCLCTEVSWIDPFFGYKAEEGAFIKDGMAEKLIAIEPQVDLVHEWFRQVARHVKETDIHGHPISIQLAQMKDGAVTWTIPEFEIVLNNAYRAHLASEHLRVHVELPMEGMADGALAWSRFAEHGGKPKLVAEWGGSHMANVMSALEAELQTGAWAMSMTDLAGVTGFWWSNEVDQEDLYKHFAAVARFWDSYDRRARHLVSSEAVVSIPIVNADGDRAAHTEFVTHPTRRALVLSNDSEAFGYIYHHHANTANVPVGKGRILFPLESEAWLELPEDLLTGTYAIEFWDPATGSKIHEREETIDPSSPGTSRIKLPDFRVDLSFKLRLASKVRTADNAR